MIKIIIILLGVLLWHCNPSQLNDKVTLSLLSILQQLEKEENSEESSKQEENSDKLIKVTEEFKTFSLLSNKSLDYLNGNTRLTTPQLTFDVQAGDKIALLSTERITFMNYFKRSSIFKSKNDMEDRKISGLFVGSHFPVFVFLTQGYLTKVAKSGQYSIIADETSVKGEGKIAIIRLQVPSIDSAIIPITESYQTIDYTLNKRIETYSFFISNQWMITAQKGTKLITDHSVDFDFYTGKERLTKENMYNRYISNEKVYNAVGLNPNTKFYSVQFKEEGDYSIVFTDFNRTKPTHKIKFK